MKNVLFHENVLSITGTTKSLIDYAYYNQKILKNKSFLAFNKLMQESRKDSIGYEKLEKSLHELVDFLDKNFKVIFYNNTQELLNFIKEENIEYVYQQKSGENDGFILPNVKNCIHAVFPQGCEQKHGDRYAFISEWLSKHCTNYEIDYVPYIIKNPPSNLEELGKRFRLKYNIPETAKVFGRIGSYNEFSIKPNQSLGFVGEAILEYLNKDENSYFIFCNTEENIMHPRAFYIHSIVDNVEKFSFIAACDAMIHARARGETFGLAISEFSCANKPVLTYKNSPEKAHIEILGDLGYYYSNKEELLNLFANPLEKKEYKKAYEKFNPEAVMERFNNVFLS
jgi:hypothetical protein